MNIKYHKLASHFLKQKSQFKITNFLQKSIREALTTRTSFHVALENCKLLNDSILYSQALSIKHICTTPLISIYTVDFNQKLKELKEICQSRLQARANKYTYNSSTKMDRKELLKERYNATSKKSSR